MKETLGFQTEVKQLLKIMIHSLYSNKEIFLRELISNASDAADKLRFESLKDQTLLSESPDLFLQVEFDKEKKTISIMDNGIGMSRQEVIDHLGTIAKSGTAQFLNALSGDEKQDTQLIGQFGVGFYSAFVVAKKVEVFSRRAGLKPEEGVHWESAGEGDFSVENIVKPDRGTMIVLHLREGEEEFADGWKLRSIIQKYSDHISLPIYMFEDKTDAEEMSAEEMSAEALGEGEEALLKEESKESEENKEAQKELAAPKREVINKATALWVRSKSEISDEEYKEFYKHVSHDWEEPLVWGHNKVEGALEYTSLLFIPKRAPFDLYNREVPRGLKLYVQRIFIMDQADQFLPLYLRFIKGVVDSNSLSLNVSREILQNNKSIESMKGALTKRVLDMLLKFSKDEPEKYTDFWKSFGAVLKEGPAEDRANKEKIADLMRFVSTSTGNANQTVSLRDYISRMKEGQEKIYYLTAENYATALGSPHLEIFKKKGIEVLLMIDRIDEWMLGYLSDFDGKHLQSISKGTLDLGKLADEEEKKEQEKLESEHKDLTKRFKEALGDQVQDVRITTRLTDSPCCLVLGAYDMGLQMREIMKAAGQAVPASKPSLEINLQHPLIERLKEEAQDDRFQSLAAILFDQASLAEGGQLDDPAAYVKRINTLLLDWLK